MNTENRAWWYKEGERMERAFVEHIVPRLGLPITINPEKATKPWVPDLLDNGALADLKTVRTPFFTAGKYDKDPSRTVTFNVKDYNRYKSLYPEITVYFYVHWRAQERFGSQVDAIHGLWRTTIAHVGSLMDADRAPEHYYDNRQGDLYNANSSVLLSLDDLERVAYL